MWKISSILFFPDKFLDFHTPNFLVTFFSHLPQISNYPHFACFNTFPSDSKSPLFSKNSPAFYILYEYFPSAFTVVHLCITQYTYWTPLGPALLGSTKRGLLP